MTDSAMGLERTTPTTGYSPTPVGDFAGTTRGVQSPFLGLDAGPADLTEFTILLRRAVQSQDAGKYDDAELCFKAALDIGDRTMAADHPDLMMLLSDLTRLYLKQSSFAAAEPLLLRLLELKRAKGDSHPEVATVLASLATVQQGLGRHESAEQLWRRVLDIRERTLAPNHLAIAIALEHLGDVCAARGKIRESLTSLEQALTIRERTLGAEHPSLRVVRERISDLKLQASEDSLSAGLDLEPSPNPERYRLLSGGAAAVVSTMKPIPADSAQRPGLTESPPKLERVATLMIPRARPVEKAASESTEDSDDSGATSALQAATIPYRDVLDSIRDEMEAPELSITARARTALASLIPLPAKKHVTAALVASVLVLLLVGGAASSRSWAVSDPSIGSGATTAAQPAASVVVPVSLKKLDDSLAEPRAAVAEPTEKAAVARVRASEDRPAAKKIVEKKSETKSIAIPTLSSAISSRLDSVAAKAASAPTQSGDAFAAPSAPAPVTSRRAGFGDSQLATSQRARLIGELPMPKVPASVAEVQGEVVVRFTVGVDGHPVMASFSVVKSPNQFLTAAVQKEIPSLRFEPARSGGADSKAVTDVVEIAYKFSSGSH